MRTPSVKVKLAFWSVLCIFVVIIASRVFGVYETYSFFTAHHKQTIRSHMELATKALQTPLRNTDYIQLREYAQRISQFSGITGVRITDSNDAVLIEQGTFDGQELAVPVQEDRPVGTIAVSFSQDPFLRGVTHIFSIEAMVLVGLLLATFGVLWGLTRYYLNDLSALTVLIRDDPEPSGREYPGAARRDEVGLLAATLRDRDRDIAAYQHELEAYKKELENKVEKRTQELRQSKQLSETILNSIPDAISLMEVQNYTILDVNTPFTEFYGLDKQEVIGRTCYDVRANKHAGCSDEEQKCPITAYFEYQRPVAYEHVLQAPNNTQRYVEVSAWPVQYETGVVEQMVHVERDITAQKRMEEQRKQVEQIVRHDLKSPINGIYGMAQLLEMPEETDPQERAEYIQNIKGAVNKMLHMINNSMDLQRMAEGTYSLQAEPVDLVWMVTGLQNDWQHLEKNKSLRVAMYVEDEPLSTEHSLVIQGEKTKLESMFSNLMVNALEASPTQETITVRIYRQDQRVSIRIHNWGVIPVDIQDRFFERYVTAGKNHGTGLGTYSARLVARAHGGDISFTTSPEQGTTLIVDLPV
ncbi:MAG: PAS domain-containing sensor histidine kinase [Thermodesulfobacteriota bacterium]